MSKQLNTWQLGRRYEFPIMFILQIDKFVRFTVGGDCECIYFISKGVSYVDLQIIG